MPLPALDPVALARYKRASEDARSLPPNLLTNSQRLKLYALFKQAEGPAPESGPSRFDAVARAKWEAWNDVRSLSAEQAVESYCSIIEGLVAITGGAAAALSPANGHAGAAAGESGSGAPEEAVVTVVGEAVVAEAAPADSAGEAVAAASFAPPPALSPAPTRTARQPPELAAEPEVEAQRWAATALSLAPGATFEVPIFVPEPSRCRYSFTVAAADGSVVGFSIGLLGMKPQATARAAQHDGEIEVPGGVGGMLVVTLDNNNSMFSNTVVACEVVTEPLSQLAAVSRFRERQLLRHNLFQAQEELAAQDDALAAIAAEEVVLQDELEKAQAAVEAAAQRIAANSARGSAVETRKCELQDEVRALQAGVGKMLWEATQPPALLPPHRLSLALSPPLPLSPSASASPLPLRG